MRIARFALVGALLLGASACQTDDGGGVNANIPPLAFVRYINAVPDTFNLTVRWVDQLDFTPMTFVNVPYRGMGQGGYQGLEAGSRHFRVFTYDPIISGTNNTGGAVTAQMADTTFDFQAGQYYTILHLGYARTGQTPAQRVYILNDAVPASNGQVQVRLLHAGIGAGAVDAFATTDQFTALTGAPAIANVGYNTTSAFISRASGAFAMQLAATGTTASIMGTSATTGVAGSATADPIAGATVNGSVLTALALPAATRPSPAANYTQVEASGLSIDSVALVTTDTFEVRGTAARSWAVNRFARTANSVWTLTQTPPACPTVTAPSTIRCQSRPTARTDTVIANTATNVTVRVNPTPAMTAYRSTQFRDTVDLAVGTARVVDTIYSVVGGFELRDSTASWTAGAFNARTDTTWTITLTPAACTALPAGPGWERGCPPRPAVRRFRVTTNAAGTAQTAEDLTAYQQSWFVDTLRNTQAVGGPVTILVRTPNTRMQVTREIGRAPIRSTFSITGNNPPAIHWFADRQPPRTTTP